MTFLFTSITNNLNVLKILMACMLAIATDNSGLRIGTLTRYMSMLFTFKTLHKFTLIEVMFNYLALRTTAKENFNIHFLELLINSIDGCFNV
jgi:hypothetical protein